MLEHWYLKDVGPDALMEALDVMGGNPSFTDGSLHLRAWCGWLEFTDLGLANAVVQQLGDTGATLVRSEAHCSDAGDEIELFFRFSAVFGTLPSSSFEEYTYRQDKPAFFDRDEVTDEFYSETAWHFLEENPGPFQDGIYLSPPPDWNPRPVYQAPRGGGARVFFGGSTEHDGHRIAFELRTRGLLVPEAPPDLTRWLERLSRRYGMDDPNDPEHPSYRHFWDAMNRFTRKERATSPALSGVFSYKLTEPGRWGCSSSEAEALGKVGVSVTTGCEAVVLPPGN